MPEVDTKLRIDNSDASRGIRQFRKDLNTLPTTAARSAERATGNVRRVLDRQFGSMRRGLRDIRTLFAEIAIGFGTGAVIRQIFNLNAQLLSAKNALGAFTGSAKQTDLELKAIGQEAQRLGLDLVLLTDQWTKLRAATANTNLSVRETFEVFQGVAEAARVLNLTTQRTEGAFRAIIQMFSKGKIQAEELRGQLAEQVVGAFQLAEKAMKAGRGELDKWISDGRLIAEDLVPKMAKQFQETFGPALPAAIATSQAGLERLKNTFKIFVQENQAFETIFKDFFIVVSGFLDAWNVVIRLISNAFTVLLGSVRVVFNTIVDFVSSSAKRAWNAFHDLFLENIADGLRQLGTLAFVPGNVADQLNLAASALSGLSFTNIVPFEKLMKDARARLRAYLVELDMTADKTVALFQRIFGGPEELVGADPSVFPSDKPPLVPVLTPENLRAIEQIRNAIGGVDKIIARFEKMRELIIVNTKDFPILTQELIDKLEIKYQRDLENFALAQLQKQEIFAQLGNDTLAVLKLQLQQQTLEINAALRDGIITAETAESLKQRLQNIFAIDSIPFFRGMRQELEFLGEDLDKIGIKIQETFGGIAGQAINDVADSIASAVVEGNNLSEALKRVGRSIVTEILSSIIKLGIQMLINAVLGKTILAASTAASAASATALAVAWYPAALYASIATFGAAAAAGATAVAAATAAGLAVTAGVTAASSGAGAIGRAHGGPVGPERTFRVGEGSNPEIFKARSGAQFFIPPEQGIVTPLKRLERFPAPSVATGSKKDLPNVVVNIIGAPSEPEVNRSITDEGMEIDIVFSRVEKNIASRVTTGESDLAIALERTYGLQRNRGRF